MTNIDPRVHRALDGELPLEALPAELRVEAERLLEVAALLAAAPAAASVATRVMAHLRTPRPSRWRRAAQWIAQPQAVTLHLRPVWSLAIAAALAVVALFPSGNGALQLGPEEGIAQFVLPASGAHSVHVAGSFNDWLPTAIALEDRDHDGVWRATLVLPVGQHEYMFVVDGERWVADPNAGRYIDDDFGRENAVLIVRPASR
jgi:hypothetical protein